jgi:soluble lytic murein transglycosylase-like protein
MRKPGVLFAVLLLLPAVSCSADTPYHHYNQGEYDAYLARSTGNSALALFVRARALYETDRNNAAAPLFRRVMESGGVLGDVGRWYLGLALKADGKEAEALKVFAPLGESSRSPAMRKRSLAQQLTLARSLKDWTALARIAAAGLLEKPDDRRCLRAALDAADKTGDNAHALALSFRLLATAPSGDDNKQALKAVEAAAPGGKGLTAARWRLYTEALIRSGDHGKAIRVLTAAKNPDPETRLNLSWALQLNRRFAASAAILEDLAAYWKNDPDNTRRLRVHRLQLELGRGDFTAAWSLLPAISDNRALVRIFSDRVNGNPAWSLRINSLGAKNFPAESVYQERLFKYYISAALKGPRGKILALYPSLAPLVTSKELKSGMLFFLARAAAASGDRPAAAAWAGRVIDTEPFGYYHSQLAAALPGITPRLPDDRDGSLPRACRELLHTGQGPSPATLAARWRQDRLAALIADGADPAALVDPADRELYRHFFHNRLWKDAWLVLFRSLQERGILYGDIPPRYLPGAAALARRAGENRWWFYAVGRMLAHTGWGLEILWLKGKVPNLPELLDIYPRPFGRLFKKWTARNGLPSDLVYALTRQESAFQHRVASWAGACGLMQVMPLTGMNLAAEIPLANIDLLDPETNIRLGTRFLGWLHRAYRHPADILIGYNAGPGRINTWKRRYKAGYGTWDFWGFVETIPYAETKGYIKAVFSNLMVYRFLEGK